MPSIPFHSGEYRGEFFDERSAAALAPALAHPAAWLAGAARIPTSGPHAAARQVVVGERGELAVAIKSFAAPWAEGALGSRARRSFRTALRLAERGVGTPRPLAYLERREGGRLRESHYLCEYLDGAASFRDELQRLYRDDPLARRILALLQAVAAEAARMHAAGVCHLDLGNQNILVARDGPDAWKEVRFIDLDRARVRDALTLRERARDLSRIALPSDFLRIFRHMYFGAGNPPREYLRWEAFYRRGYALHAATRRVRHPLRALRAARRPGTQPAALAGRELWIWDDLSAQTAATLERRSRYADYPWRNGFYIVRGLARHALPVRARYHALLEAAFRREVDLAGRIGLAVGTDPGMDAREWPLLEALGTLPVLLRLYRHATDAERERVLADARRLKAAGHGVYLALVQDRAGTREGTWPRFVAEWLPRFSGIADQVEIGHAVNRVKWGVWDLREYRAMVAAVVEVARRSGPFRLTGPAAIDFEYHFLAGFLEMLPQDGALDALSHHLYVDRRGAPENRQGRFAAVEKFALAKAFAGASAAFKSDRLVVSEVNWPIRGTGVHSPVCAPYVPPGSGAAQRGEDEDPVADYLVRYYALALCSGLVDAVYWWRLAAHGFGLVDDLASPWRERPAYAALRQFARFLGGATFVERLSTPAGTWALRFRLPGGGAAVMAWAHPGRQRFAPPFAHGAVLSRDGRELAADAAGVLGPSPMYYLEVR